MANALKMDLRNQYVIVADDVIGGDPVQRVMQVKDGFGAAPFTMGTKCIGKHVASDDDLCINGYDIERLATQDEIKKARARCAEKAGA